MGRKSKYTIEEKINACEECLENKASFFTIVEKLRTVSEVVRRWYLEHKEYGLDAFNESNTNKSYSIEVKFYNNGSNLKGMTPNQYRYHSYSNFIYF